MTGFLMGNYSIPAKKAKKKKKRGKEYLLFFTPSKALFTSKKLSCEQKTRSESGIQGLEIWE